MKIRIFSESWQLLGIAVLSLLASTQMGRSFWPTQDVAPLRLTHPSLPLYSPYASPPPHSIPSDTHTPGWRIYSVYGTQKRSLKRLPVGLGIVSRQGREFVISTLRHGAIDAAMACHARHLCASAPPVVTTLGSYNFLRLNGWEACLPWTIFKAFLLHFEHARLALPKSIFGAFWGNRRNPTARRALCIITPSL